jgi:MSHA biogenesis protein MshP
MRRQAGFGVIAAIVILVILASLAAAIVKFGFVEQMSSAQDTLTARATSAARAGNEWGLHQALKGGWAACAGVVQTLDLTVDTGFQVTVTCNSILYNEGESAPGTARTVRVYSIDAVACNMPLAAEPKCPNNGAAASPAYVERRRQVTATN